MLDKLWGRGARLAQAISRDARLIARNRRDFERIEGLRLEVWSVR